MPARRNTNARTAALTAAAGMTVGAATAAGQMFTWTGAASQLWSNGGNWTPAGGPPSGAGHSAEVTVPGIVNINNINPVIDSLSLTHASAEVHVQPGLKLTVGGLANQGIIRVHPPLSGIAAFLEFSAPATITGSGTILLRTNAELMSTVPTNVIENSAPHTIAGSGRIPAQLVNRGRVVADDPGRDLGVGGNLKTNYGQMIATNGGILGFEGGGTPSPSIVQPGGTLVADGGTLDLRHGSVTGGTIEVANGGQIRVADTTITNAVVDSAGTPILLEQSLSLIGVSGTNGPIDVAWGQTLYINNPDWFNDDTISVLGSKNTRVHFGAPTTTLHGTGEIDLEGGRIDATSPTNVLINSDTHTIRGSGDIRIRLVNDGLVLAEDPGLPLYLTLEPKDNHSEMKAVNNAVLGFQEGSTPAPITQTSGAKLIADGGTLDLRHGSVTGGTIEVTTPGGKIRVAGTTISNATVDSGGTLILLEQSLSLLGITGTNGPIHVPWDQTLRLETASFTNDDLISVEAGGNARIHFTSPNTILQSPTGLGVIELQGSPGGGSPRIDASGPYVVVNSAGHTIRGNGAIAVKLTNQGTLSVGPSTPGPGNIGEVSLGSQAALQCAPTSVIVIEAAGTSAALYDRITGPPDAAFVCGGTLRFQHVQGFTGSTLGQFLDVVNGPAVSGTFDQVELPQLPGSKKYVVNYLPNRVRICTSCWPDCNGDCQMTVADFGCFQTKFVGGNPYADCNGDGVLNVFDFGCFQTRFVQGCPG